jgi:hypothetical protein
MKRITIIVAALAVFLFAVVAAAGQTKIFEKYEGLRQALLSGSLNDVQSTAKELGNAARAEKQNAIAERASALASTTNLEGARDSFAVLSEEVIRFRDARSGNRPVVVYCSMERKSWLQPKGAIANPYVDQSMRSCGEVRKEKLAPAPPASPGHH